MESLTGPAEPAGVDGTRAGEAHGEALRAADLGRANSHIPDLFRRHAANPLLSASDWPYAAHTVFNPGATLLPSGETLLLVRVEDRRGISHLTAARSSDGIGDWRIDARPTFLAEPEQFPEELWGVEDARIVRLEGLGCFAVTYTAYSRAGPLVALATTEDFRTFERHGSIMSPEDKDAAFFPRQFGGRWALIHRPVPNSVGAKANMWLSLTALVRRRCFGGVDLTEMSVHLSQCATR